MKDLLVSTDWLYEHLNDDNIRIVDIRGRVMPASDPLPHYYAHRESYEEGHLPSAVFVDWTKDIVAHDSPSQDIADPQAFADMMQQLGIGDEHLVIAYDDAGGIFSARLWWALNYYGHEKVAVLDGGWQKWQREAKPVTSEKTIPTLAVFTPIIQEGWRVTAQDILSRNATTPLIDVRTPQEYRGESSRAKRKGHIPNAVNIPRNNLISPDGTMPTSDVLRATLEANGIEPNMPEVILYCNGGVSASYGLLALKVAGYQGGTVYDGSWKDWGNDPTKPIV